MKLLTYQWVPGPPRPAWWFRSEEALRHAMVARWVNAPCCLAKSLETAIGWASR